MNDQTDPNAQPDFRAQIAALTDIVEKLEDPEVSLEESLTLYETGIKLAQQAGKTLELAEQRVALLTEDGELQALHT